MSIVEKCWMITSKASIVIYLVVIGICFGVFVFPYMKMRKSAVMVSIAYIITMLILYIIPPQISNSFAYMLGVAVAFAVMYTQDRRNIYQKIFFAVTFFSIRTLAVAMAAGVSDIIADVLIFNNAIAQKMWLQYWLYVVTRVLDIAICAAFIAGSVWLINKAYVRKKDEMNIKELIMLIIPSLVGITGYSILQNYLNMYENDTGKWMYDSYGFYGALSFVHYMICIIAIVAMIVMFQKWKEKQEEQLGYELVLNQAEDMKRHIEEVEKLYQDIRSLRHDMGNHIQTLEHLVELKDTKDAAEYMNYLKNEWNAISPAIKTGSPVIDVILQEKLRQADERNIIFTSDFHYPQNTKLNVFDLSVILNNALNNCLENVNGSNPYISISSFQQNSVFMIIIKNSFAGEINWDDNGLPKTTKSEKGHGIGLNNILRVAKLYMGDISFEQTDDEVILSIMLQIK